MGVHDHGFNNVSTYGGLWRLAGEDRIDATDWEVRFYELALKVSGAVQARRWTRVPDGGFIHSFNGAHSLFVDTIRSLRALALSHRARPPAARRAGRGGQPARPPGAARAGHGASTPSTTARAATPTTSAAASRTRACSTRQRHLSLPEHAAGIFAVLDLDARARVGDARLRRTDRVHRDAPRRRLAAFGGRARDRCDGCSTPRAPPATSTSSQPRRPTACPTGTPGAPGLAAPRRLGPRPADPFNDHEPVDSSAAAIAAQGLLRLGQLLERVGDRRRALLSQAGLQVLATLLDERGPYLSTDPDASGPAAPLDLSPAERLGPRARRARAFLAASRASGATTTCAKRRCCAAAGADAPYLDLLRTADDDVTRTASRSSPAARAASASGSRGRSPPKDGRSRCAACGPSGRRRRRSTIVRRSRAVRPGGCRRAAADRERLRRLGRRRVPGGIHALVNNAGRAPRVRADLLEASEDSFEELLRINLQGPYFLTQQIARRHGRRARRRTRRSRARSSSSPRCRRRWCPSIAASTASARPALAMAAQLFAVRLAEHGIPVYEVRPGHHRDRHDRRRARASTTSASPTGLVPERRWGTPDDVGRVVAALLRGDLPYATGSVIHVDGGLRFQALSQRIPLQPLRLDGDSEVLIPKRACRSTLFMRPVIGD